MTKKNYIAIAKLYKECNLDDSRNHPDSFIIALASYLKQDNPNFNYTAFIKACGLVYE